MPGDRDANWGTVRFAESEDLPALGRLLAECRDIPQWPGGAWRTFTAAHGAGEPVRRALFVSTDRLDELAGAIAVSCLDQTTELELLVVRPAWRRKGLGRVLSEAWLNWAARVGATEALLEVRASNAPAQALYQQLGFRAEGKRRAYYRDPEEDGLLMRKDL